MELRLDILKFNYFGVVHTIRNSFSCERQRHRTEKSRSHESNHHALAVGREGLIN